MGIKVPYRPSPYPHKGPYDTKGPAKACSSRGLCGLRFGGRAQKSLPIGPKVVPFWGSYLEFYKGIPKGTTLGVSLQRLSSKPENRLNPN